MKLTQSQTIIYNDKTYVNYIIVKIQIENDVACEFETESLREKESERERERESGRERENWS